MISKAIFRIETNLQSKHIQMNENGFDEICDSSETSMGIRLGDREEAHEYQHAVHRFSRQLRLHCDVVKR